MSNNPFEAPQVSDDQPPTVRKPKAIHVSGGVWTVAAVGVVTGLAISASAQMQMEAALPSIAAGSALVMLGACASVAWLIRGIPFTLLGRLGVVFALTISSCILFVPICTASGLVATFGGMSQMYGPSPLGFTIACVVGSVGGLCIAMRAALWRLRRREFS